MTGRRSIVGALVQHHEHGWRYVSNVLPIEPGRVNPRLWLEPRIPITMEVDLMPDGSLSDGWEFVGVDGHRPEGATLAWVVTGFVDSQHRKKLFGETLGVDHLAQFAEAVEFVRLNPLQGNPDGE